MSIARTVLTCVFLLASNLGWGRVLVYWTSTTQPPAKELGIRDLVLTWSDAVSPQIKAARRQGYSIYVEVSVAQAEEAAESGAKIGVGGIILSVRQNERTELEKTLARLRAAHPKTAFLVLYPNGKQPQMRGSMVIKRGSVLEVSSPTAQPWIDTNLALIKIEQRAEPEQVPLYSFSWEKSESDQQESSSSEPNYSLAVAEAGAFHADLVLEMDEHLQKGLLQHDREAFEVWNKVRSYLDFYSHPSEQRLEAAANVAVVVDDLDSSDEVMNLLARHNVPFKVLRLADLKAADASDFDLIVLFAKPDAETGERVTELAARGKTVVVVDAHGSYPWQKGEPIRVNEQTVSYSVGSGKVLELSEAVTDPETFAQDIRRLLGKENALMSLWNGLTTVAVPYGERGEGLELLELINYADEPLRVQVQVKGSFSSIRYERPERPCCESLAPVEHDGFTEFVIPDLRIAGRVHLESKQAAGSKAK